MPAAVLILVLVEDGLGESLADYMGAHDNSLNPCFSGGWSRSLKYTIIVYIPEHSLNPCFSGGWSRSL